VPHLRLVPRYKRHAYSKKCAHPNISRLETGRTVLSSRANEIVRNVDRTNLELADMLASLTEADLALPCADPSGGTVSEIVTHLSEGAPEVFAYLAAVLSGSYTPPAPKAPIDSQHHHDHDHDHDGQHDHDGGATPQSVQPAVVLELVRARRQIFTEFLAKLTDEQLESVAPVAPGITDGTRTLAEVIDDMIDHQAQHLAYMRESVQRRPEPTDTP
jgi:hypothetical protein